MANGNGPEMLGGEPAHRAERVPHSEGATSEVARESGAVTALRRGFRALFGRAGSGRNEETTPDFSLETLVNEQYERALAILSGGLYDSENPSEDDVNPPTLEEARAVLAEGLTPQQVEAIRGMQMPVFMLKPLTRFGRFMNVLNSGINADFPFKRPHLKAAIDERLQPKLLSEDTNRGLGDEIVGWEVGVGEAAKLHGRSGELRALVSQWQRESREKGVRVPSHREHALLQRNATFEKVRPIDDGVMRSVLRSEIDDSIIGEDGMVAEARWSGDHPYFGERDSNEYDTHPCAVFRPVVMVPVPRPQQ